MLDLRSLLQITTSDRPARQVEQITRPSLVSHHVPAESSSGRWTRLNGDWSKPPITAIVWVSDPIAYAASLLVIVAACLLAAWIPAARAARLARGGSGIA